MLSLVPITVELEVSVTSGMGSIMKVPDTKESGAVMVVGDPRH